MSIRWTPSIVPNDREATVYIVEDDFGKNGRCYRETEIGFEDLENTINDLISGQYHHPVRVIAFNTEEGCPLTTACPIDKRAAGLSNLLGRTSAPEGCLGAEKMSSFARPA